METHAIHVSMQVQDAFKNILVHFPKWSIRIGKLTLVGSENRSLSSFPSLQVTFDVPDRAVRQELKEYLQKQLPFEIAVSYGVDQLSFMLEKDNLEYILVRSKKANALSNEETKSIIYKIKQAQKKLHLPPYTSASRRGVHINKSRSKNAVVVSILGFDDVQALTEKFAALLKSMDAQVVFGKSNKKSFKVLVDM